jgi:hypothetical protein
LPCSTAIRPKKDASPVIEFVQSPVLAGRG